MRPFSPVPKWFRRNEMDSNCCTSRASTSCIAPLLIGLMGIWLLLAVLAGIVHAKITLDGSLGPKGPLGGPDYVIGADLGQVRGSNLFHSFGEFNVLTGESATFTGPNAIENILGRVTGGSQSFIDGLLRSEISGANLFLLNPSGVLFGPNATLEVSGSFYVSTADYLRLADGGIFSADLSQESVLTVAPPEAFGYLGENPASISVEGSRLEVPEGKGLSLVGGEVRMVGGKLLAPGGRIDVASVASAGEVVPNPPGQVPDLKEDGFERLGRIDLSQKALVATSGSGGGTVLIRGGAW